MKQESKKIGEEIGVRYDLQQILSQAEVDYERSQKEMYRPSTDVVLYSACFYARRALHQYLFYCYKKYNGPASDKSPHDLTVMEMAEYCSQHDERIAKIDFEAMNCSRSDVLEEEEVFFCNDVDKVGSCKTLSEQMREVVLKS
ncbi:hypothetical protein QLX67_08800 [Balneolaceae bacterium ANBcel3]|nr:hypothetical protein [Balneolaceae bacterium ANBcel3]